MTALTRQWHILRALTEQPRSVGSLARQFSVSKGTAQRDIDTLAQVFEVAEHPSPTHKQRRLYTAVIGANRPDAAASATSKVRA